VGTVGLRPSHLAANGNGTRRSDVGKDACGFHASFWKAFKQTTATEVRLDHGKAAGSGAARPSVSPFWLSVGRLRSNFFATRLDEQTIAPNHSESGQCQTTFCDKRAIAGHRPNRGLA
jgi:hypothetical protein